MRFRTATDFESISDVKNSMISLLHAWRLERSPLASNWDLSEIAQWNRILPASRAVAPRTVLKGAQDIANLNGLTWEIIEN